MHRYNLKISYLLSALVIALALFASMPVDAQEVDVQQWEYAHVLSATQEKVVFAYMADADEEAAIKEELDALPRNQVGTLTMLNIMGDYGWELVIYDTSQQSNGFLAFIFKRPVD
jgi:hypothetical protein